MPAYWREKLCISMRKVISGNKLKLDHDKLLADTLIIISVHCLSATKFQCLFAVNYLIRRQMGRRYFSFCCFSLTSDRNDCENRLFKIWYHNVCVESFNLLNVSFNLHNSPIDSKHIKAPPIWFDLFIFREKLWDFSKFFIFTFIYYFLILSISCILLFFYLFLFKFLHFYFI